MSLKAYEGMMSRKSLFHIQSEIKRIYPQLEEVSKNHLAKAYANLIVDYADCGVLPTDSVGVKIDSSHLNRILKGDLNDIKLEDTTLLSIVYQISNIFSKSDYINNFTAHLNITIEAVNNRKTLIYPNIIVNEHRPILLEIFEDWYAQNQVDKPEDVDARQWRQRVKDWYSFNEFKGMSTEVKLFNPHRFDSLNRTFRGDELIEKVLEHIPSQKKRIYKLGVEKIQQKDMEDNPKETKEAKDNKNYSYFMNMNRKWRSEEKKAEVEQFIQDNNVTVIDINEEYLNAKKDFSKKD